MQVSVLNLTQETLLVTLSGSGSDSCVSTSVSPSHNTTFTCSRQTTSASLELTSKGPGALHYSLTISWRRFKRRSVWELIPCDSTVPWTIYKLQGHLMILPKRSLSSFLADMPSSVPLSSLMLPGTHESVAFYGWPISQCQNPATPLSVQLKSGIRAIDVRLSVINSALISHHGIYSEKLSFLDILRVVHTFLNSSEGKTETIIMSVKQEDKASDLFSQLVHNAVYNGPGGKQMWFLENRIPTLGEVRGKVVMFSRFGGDGMGWEGGLEGLCVHPTIWPDSKPSGFEWWLKGTKVKTHDWYSISTFTAIPEKATQSSGILLQQTPQPHYPILSISYLSASSFPLALPPLVACGFGWPAWGLGVEGVNSRVGKWILSLLSGNIAAEKSRTPIKGEKDFQTNKGDTAFDGPTQTEPRLRGWCFIDYYKEPVDVGLVQLLVECNYRGRKPGEEGWT